MKKLLYKLAQTTREQRAAISTGLVLSALYVVPRIPYVNLFRAGIISGITWFAILVTVGFRAKKLFTIAVVLFLLLLFFTLVGDGEMIEYLGNTIYFIIASAGVASIREFISQEHE